MVDWFDLTHWQAILAAIVAIGTPIVAMLAWFKPLLRWFRSRPKSKVRQKGITLSFVSKDRHCRWSPARGNDQSGTYIAGIWNVTNSSESDVVILKARLSKYQTQFVQVSTYDPSVEGFGASYPIHSNQMSEVSADFIFFPSIGRAPKPIISDVIFTDNFRNEHRVRTQFSYIGPKPVHEPPLWSRWLRRRNAKLPELVRNAEN